MYAVNKTVHYRSGMVLTKGTIVNIDEARKKLTVKPENGNQVEIEYSQVEDTVEDQLTQVSVAEDAPIDIHYQEDATYLQNPDPIAEED